MKTYSIFLASSFELQPEREKFEIFIGRQNKRLLQKKVQLRLEIWEDMGSELNNSRKQEDYNKILSEAEILVLLFWKKVGKFTREEFDLAYSRFVATGRPLIYIYEKTELAIKPTEDWENQSKADFKKMLVTPGKEQFHSTFDHYAVLLSHFQNTLLDLFSKDQLTFGDRAKLMSVNGPLSPTFFIGRDSDMEAMSEKFKTKGQLVLLSGEGGMGKTTLASKYWYENQYTYGNSAYLFCDGGILNALVSDGLGMNMTGLSYENKLLKLHHLFNELGEDFLLFLDNANEPEDIRSFLQKFTGLQGNVLITSRCRNVLVDTRNEMLLDHLYPKEAKDLFLEYYSEKGQDFDQLLDRFLEGLNYHTLLIEIFAKNLREASELGMDLKGFLEELKTKGLILDEDNNFEIRSAWAVSVDKKAATTNDILEILYDFKKLSEEERLFLVNLSLIPSENYTLEFLLELFEPENKRLFRDILKSLYQKGWIGGTDRGDKPQYRLSPVIQSLVQAKNRDTLWEDGKSLFLRLKELLKNEEEKDNTYTKFRWLPFGKFFISIFPKNDQEYFNSFLNHFALILRAFGGESNLLEAKIYLENVLTSNVKRFGKDHEEVARTRNNLANVLKDIGGKSNLMKAKTYLEQGLTSAIANFGEDSYDVAIFRSNLGTTLIDIGRKSDLMEAKILLEQALEWAIANKSGSSIEALYRSYYGNFIGSHGGKENLIYAIFHLERALVLDISNFGENSSRAAISHSNLSIVLKDIGGVSNLYKAKDHLEKAVATSLFIYGKYSHEVERCRAHLALVLVDLGGKKNLLEAKTLLENALASDSRRFGSNHPIILLLKYNLGFVLVKLLGLENLHKALILFDEALKGYRITFEKDYFMVPIILKSIKNAKKKLK